MVGLELMTRKSAYMLKGKIAGLSIISVMNRYCILSPRASPYLNPQRNSLSLECHEQGPYGIFIQNGIGCIELGFEGGKKS